MNRKDFIILDDDFYFIIGEGHGRFPASHGFLFTNQTTVLLDAGIGETKIKEIDREKRIDILIISHTHPDHIRSAYLLHDRFILVPKETPEGISDLDLLGERFIGTVEGGRKWAAFVEKEFNVHALPDPDARFGDGDVLKFGRIELEAIHTPGHTIDHYCFLHKKSGTLITTDIDLTSFGPWYGNPESDIQSFRSSIEKIRSLLYTRVCSSHRLPIEGKATEEFEAYLSVFAKHKQKVLDLCINGATLEEMADMRPFYGAGFKFKAIQNFFETQMISKNLALLMKEGQVEKCGERYKAIL